MIGDGNGLESEVGNLGKDEMRERLYVAEKVMKTLFKRNKELEEAQLEPQQQEMSTSQKCQVCARNGVEEVSGASDDLRARIKDLEKSLLAA